MLKRAKCTIYMVQESDTLGKDSELASTLAQKKPVIAFIPKYDISEIEKSIEKCELDELLHKIYLFKAQRIFMDEEFIDEIKKELNLNSDTIKNIIESFLEDYENYRKEQKFTLWDEKEKEFKSIKYKEFSNLCKILSYATRKYFDYREEVLKGKHPLAMQIDMISGVANGVLVVREIDKCVKLLKQIITNSLEFEIKHEEGYTGLFEKNTGSIYRIITDDKTLTNSFWNFFYKV